MTSVTRQSIAAACTSYAAQLSTYVEILMNGRLLLPVLCVTVLSSMLSADTTNIPSKGLKKIETRRSPQLLKQQRDSRPLVQITTPVTKLPPKNPKDPNPKDPKDPKPKDPKASLTSDSSFETRGALEAMAVS